MVAALLIVASVALGGSDIEPDMRTSHLPPISKIIIQKRGASSGSDDQEQCADFNLSSEEIREYLSKASQVAKHDYLHMLDWSPCSVSGKVTFKNRTSGLWSIQQYRAGSLKLSSGKTLYLYCPQCQAKAFPATETKTETNDAASPEPTTR